MCSGVQIALLVATGCNVLFASEPASPSCSSTTQERTESELGRLDFSKQEVKNVLNGFRDGGPQKTVSITCDQPISRIDLSDVRFLHFATHAFLEPPIIPSTQPSALARTGPFQWPNVFDDAFRSPTRDLWMAGGVVDLTEPLTISPEPGQCFSFFSTRTDDFDQGGVVYGQGEDNSFYVIPTEDFNGDGAFDRQDEDDWLTSIEYVNERSARITFTHRVRGYYTDRNWIATGVPPFTINVHFSNAPWRRKTIRLDPFGHTLPKIRSPDRFQVNNVMALPRKLSVVLYSWRIVVKTDVVFSTSLSIIESSWIAPPFVPLRL
jgi:hypothetical protein